MALYQDARFAFRLIAKDRWTAAVIVVTLALGIGLNGTVFTLVNAVLIRGVPFPEASQLYVLGARERTRMRGGPISLPDLRDWREQSRSFSAIGAFAVGGVNLSDDQQLPEQARGTWVTANAFDILRQPPLLGRTFRAGDDVPGAPRVVILGYTLWQSRYGADRGVIGRLLRVDGEPATIVGVMPPDMMFPTRSALWMPIGARSIERDARDNRWIVPFGRLRDDATRAQAHAELDAITARIARSHPDSHREIGFASVETFNERFNGGEIRQVFLALLGAVGVVLLIACANVANLQLARAANRTREIALRTALGATRLLVIRQLLVESLVLSAIGAGLALLVTLGGVRLFDAALPAESGKPYWVTFTIDWTVVGYLAAVCLCSALAFGLMPALVATRTSVDELLKEGGRGSVRGRWHNRLSGALVVVQLALTVVLLSGGGLMLRSFLQMSAQDPGFDEDGLVTARLQLPRVEYETRESRQVFFGQLHARLAAIPGAAGAAIATQLPLLQGDRRGIEIEGRPLAAGADAPSVTSVAVSPSFFETVGVALQAGRAFAAADDDRGLAAIVVNRQFADELFGRENPIGRRIRFVPRGREEAVEPWGTIVGVSATIRHTRPQSTAVVPVVYRPLRSEPPSHAYLLVRSELPPTTVMAGMRQAVQSVDRDQPVFELQTFAELRAQQRWPLRVFGGVFGVLACFGLVLATVGLYAVVAYGVAQRTQEIGVRMALGAERRDVSWLVLRRGVVQLAIGLVLGLGAAWLASRAVQPLLVQVAPGDPVTLTSVATLLSAVAIAACLVPARRAARLDPVAALRRE